MKEEQRGVLPFFFKTQVFLYVFNNFILLFFLTKIEFKIYIYVLCTTSSPYIYHI